MRRSRPWVRRFSGGEEIAVPVDPATARITCEQRGVTFHSFMRGPRHHLFTPGERGFCLVTSLGFALVAPLMSGLFVCRRFRAGFRRRPRFHRDVRTSAGDLHRLMVLWSLWFVALKALGLSIRDIAGILSLDGMNVSRIVDLQAGP